MKLVKVEINNEVHKLSFDMEGFYSKKPITQFSEFHDGKSDIEEEVVDPFYFTELNHLVLANSNVNFTVIRDITDEEGIIWSE